MHNGVDGSNLVDDYNESSQLALSYEVNLGISPYVRVVGGVGDIDVKSYTHHWAVMVLSGIVVFCPCYA